MPDDSTQYPADSTNMWRDQRSLPASIGPDNKARPVSDAHPFPVRVLGQTASLSRATLTLSDAAQALPSIPGAATGARISVEGGAARVATTPPDPTPSDGERWGDGSVWQITGRADLLAFRAAAVAGSPRLIITYTAEANA